ncbi:MAG: hypothetical protein HYU25_19240 [Candidatus Rokubacteria bacterium]|nr:hypothetical protein [Candidatus Rokubacteria bacterium]
MFSGGGYDEVERWLWNFLTSHAKRVNPRIEVTLDAARTREGTSYGARLRLGARVSSLVELGFSEVAASRGSLAWCAALAERTKRLARELVAQGTADARAR